MLGRTSGGICLALNENEKGFVTYKRILNSLGKEPFDDVIDLVKEKYPKGKSVKCRILDYNRLDSVYICTVEASVLKETLFTKDDLICGLMVMAQITEITSAGLVVKFGRLQGFIENLHLSNSQYSETIKRKFRVGQKLRAKILCVKRSGSIRLTVKPALLKSNLCLYRPEQAEPGKQFPGVVVKYSRSGALVVFYGDVAGFVKSSRLFPEQTAPAQDLLFEGQVVNATVIGRSSKGIELSLIPVKQEESTETEQRETKESKQEISLGEEVSGTVTKILKKGLFVNVAHKNIEGFVPLHHLSINYDLNPLLLSTCFQFRFQTFFIFHIAF